MNILVTGSNGQLGQELQAIAINFPNYNFIYVDKMELDITNSKVVKTFFDTNAFDYCINCAAYTAVDKAEGDEKNAYKVNVLGSQYLAQACHENEVRLVQISTDYVYHNQQNTPFKEEDSTSPKGVYAQTKLDGENIASQYNKETLIIRTSWVYSSFGNNFVKTMLKLGKTKEELTIIFDQIGSPTYAYDLAKAILDIIVQNPVNFTGIYHYSNEGVCSWYDFAKAIFELQNISCNVLPIETKDYPTPAKRPPFSLLNKSKIKKDFALNIPYWKDSLKKCLAHLA